MINNKYQRNQMLLGENVINKISSSTVCVIGVGGVGGFSCESFARLGVAKVILIDKDVIDETNINRQIIALENNIGESKVDVMKKRINDINSNIEVIAIKLNLNKDNLLVLKDYKIDFLVDAIDSIDSKWELIKFCINENIDFVTILGMGNRIDPTKITIGNLEQTRNDHLAKKIRNMERNKKIN